MPKPKWLIVSNILLVLNLKTSHYINQKITVLESIENLLQLKAIYSRMNCETIPQV